MLAVALAGGIAWLGLGYQQHAIHRRWTTVSPRVHVMIYIMEFAAAMTCLGGCAALYLRAW